MEIYSVSIAIFKDLDLISMRNGLQLQRIVFLVRNTSFSFIPF